MTNPNIAADNSVVLTQLHPSYVPILKNSIVNLIFILFILNVLLSSCDSENGPRVQDLNNGWNLHIDSKDSAIEVVVPGMVQTDLLMAGKIEDPFFGSNEAELQWIGKREWEYTKRFLPDPKLFEQEKIHLIFEGLDTYASVWLNNHLILETDNMFRTYAAEVKTLLRMGENNIRVKFYPPDSINKLKAKQLPFSLPEERAFSRKAPYQFGWDWGPVFVTMGIWKPVTLQGWSKVRLLSHTIHSKQIDSLKADLELELEIESTLDRAFKLQLTLKGFKLIDTYVTLKKGVNAVKVPFQIEKPVRWWPNGMGSQHLYILDLQLFDGSASFIKREIKTGLRTINLVQEPDEIGESFYFEVNGQPVFIKGANYIPEDNFPVRYSRSKTRKLLTDAVAVNMNMIRVWGGGIYPDDDFYELCDSLGLMVWQDFMYACTMYPYDESFLKNAEEEAKQQVNRLRKYPSLAIWCGNNEISEGFHNWGWERDLNWSKKERDEIWNDYLKLFEEILPKVVNTSDPFRPYWPSSPSTGWGRPESLALGDVHYWGVWWGEEPFEMYEKKVGRFHSEYGFQAMPNIESIARYVTADEKFLKSPMLEAHQKHPRGTKLIDTYMRRDFPVPDSLEQYIYMSQLLQAFGITKAIEAHRRNMPVTMGTLYWQLNDCWPVTSWSSIDYFGKWKALHYSLKDAYAPVMISVSKENDSFKVYVVNDKNEPMTARLEIDLKAMDGSILRSFTEPVKINAGTSTLVKSILKSELLTAVDPQTAFLHHRLMIRNEKIAEKLYYFVSPKDLKLEKEIPQLQFKAGNKSILLVISSHSLIKNLMLSCNDVDGSFEDNYFDLIPGEERIVNFYPSENYPADSLKFEMMTLNEFLP
ncbi:MAG: glycoside hydrolase family 2 protein [Bacteroidales bacterium]|nr:glycoside hydrolase family 2 protein [Bacteroidales bacterium]